MSYKEGGYYAKYKVERTDGKPFTEEPNEFMVLCFRDPHALEAGFAYVKSLLASNENPEFARQLEDALIRAELKYHSDDGA